MRMLKTELGRALKLGVLKLEQYQRAFNFRTVFPGPNFKMFKTHCYYDSRYHLSSFLLLLKRAQELTCILTKYQKLHLDIKKSQQDASVAEGCFLAGFYPWASHNRRKEVILCPLTSIPVSCIYTQTSIKKGL